MHVGTPVALSSIMAAAQTSALRVVCAIALGNALLLLGVTLATHRAGFAITIAAAWVLLCWTLFQRAYELPERLGRRPSLLVVLAAVGMAPIALDGGLESTLTTQGMWLTWVAAATVSAVMTLVMATTMAVSTAAALSAAGTSPHELLSGADRFQATLLIFNPIVIALVGLALVGVFRQVLRNADSTLAGVRAGAPATTPALTRLMHRAPQRLLPAPPPPPLTAAERAVLAMLHDGLTPKQIALQRVTALSTVRSHIKAIKRKTGARNLNDLIARTWPPG